MNELIFRPFSMLWEEPTAPQGVKPCSFCLAKFNYTIFKFFEGAETFSQKSFCEYLTDKPEFKE